MNERLSAIPLEETPVSTELVAQINDAGSAVDLRGAAAIDTAVGLSSFVKEDVAAVGKPLAIEEMTSEDALYYFNNPAAHLDMLLGKTSETTEMTDSALSTLVPKAVRNKSQAVMSKVNAASKKEYIPRYEKRLTEDEATQEKSGRNRIARMLGRIATSPIRGIRKVNELATVANVEILSRMPGFDSKEEKLEKMRLREEKYTIREDDGAFMRMKKRIARNAFKAAAWTGPAIMTAMAVEMIASRTVGYLGLFEHASGIDPTEALRHYEIKHTEFATNYVFGGRGDSTSEGAAGAVMARGDGSVVVPQEYNAGIAPIDPGPSLDASTAEGASSAAGKIQEQLAQDPHAQITVEGFSEGSIAAAKTVIDLANANGGKLPPNVHLVLDGSPVSDQGFWASDTAKGVAPFLHVAGIDPSVVPLPAGTEVRTSQNDLWGNGRQSLVVNGLQTLDLPNAHVVEDPNAPHVTWTDSRGVIHEEYDVGVHPITQLLSPNNPSAVPSGFNDMFNDALPVNTNMDPNAPPPKPNAVAAEQDFARGVDQAAGGAPVGEALLKMMPAGGTQVLQDGLDLANNDGNKLMDIGQNPQNAPQDIQAVMGDVNKTMSDFSAAMNSFSGGSNNGGNFIQNITNGLSGNTSPAAPVAPTPPAPSYNTYTPPSYTPPAPAYHAPPVAPPAPAAAPNFASTIQQGLNFFGNVANAAAPKR